MGGHGRGSGGNCGDLLLAIFAAVLALPAPAEAAVRTKLDRWQELRFELDGRRLTVAIDDRPNHTQNPTIQSELQGKRLTFACGTSFRPTRRNIVFVRARWPSAVDSFSVSFGRDVSQRVKWCLLEADEGEFAGGDISFVSFRKAEPGRGLTRGQLRDGTRWRIAAWRGNRLQPCLQLRVSGQDASTHCFDDEAEAEAGIAASISVPPCSDDAIVLGATARSAATVTVKLEDGTIAPATLYRRPRGSRVRSQYFVAQFPEPVEVAAVEARDAQGTLIARDRDVRGMRPECWDEAR